MIIEMERNFGLFVSESYELRYNYYCQKSRKIALNILQIFINKNRIQEVYTPGITTRRIM